MSRTETRRPGITQGLRDLADFLDAYPYLIDERTAPGQHEDVTLLVRDVETVAQIAETADTLVVAAEGKDGRVHTSTEIGFGRGSMDDGISAFSNAITLRVVHLTDAETAS
jgi:uncharacterized protein YbjT (DUF2867 family)